MIVMSTYYIDERDLYEEERSERALQARKEERLFLSGFCDPAKPYSQHGSCKGGADGLKHRLVCRCACHTTPTPVPPAAPTPDLVTPTAVLVSDATPETDEWYEARRGGITGTDLPKILGISKYGNSLSVWLKKRGELEEDAGEAAKWGQIFEDPIARRWAEIHDTSVREVGVLAHATYGWMRVSLDRLVDECPDGDGPCALEIKTRSAFKADEWAPAVPDDVLAQTAWGLMVTGLNHHHVACLLGGQRLVEHRVDHDQKLEQYLLDAAGPVWDAVVAGEPPVAHPDAEGVLLELLNRIYVRRAGDVDLVEAAARPWLDQYAEGHDLSKQGDRLKTEAKTALVQMLGDGDTGLIDGKPAFTYKAGSGADTFTAAALAELAKVSPEVYDALKSDGFITATRPSPRFNLKEKS